MEFDIEYLEYRTSGYTDDLGIIADRNQFVEAQPSGWHVFTRTTNEEWHALMNWLHENNIDPIFYYGRIVLTRETDVVLFQLRWS